MLTYNDLPEAIDRLQKKIDQLEKLLQSTRMASQQPEDCWYDIKELCSYLPEKPKKATIYSWVQQGTIPYHKRGKKLFFLKSEINDWLRKARRKTFNEIRSEAGLFLTNDMKGSQNEK